jgi:hypothetical protein
MAGAPSEAEIQAQWRAAVNVIENMRAHVDGTHAPAAGLWDVLEQSLEGTYTPSQLAAFAGRFRSVCSSLISPQMAQAAIAPIVTEYAKAIDAAATGADEAKGFGTGNASLGELFRAMYDWFVAKSYTVKSREITYDASTTAGSGNTGNGALGRLTVDENAFPLEACTVEKKLFKCVADQNSGVVKEAEVFEVIGEAASPDSVLRASYGSGTGANTTIVSKNAGSGSGGSLLRNSSFSEYDATASPKFTAWTESAAPVGSLDQDLVNYYRTHPGSQTNGSLEITGGLGTVTLKQGLSAMRARRLDVDRPYQFRVMVNKTVGSALGGNVVIRCGTNSKTVAISALGSGWQELILDFDENLWFRSFNEATMDVEIEWNTSTSGTLLVDDAIFCPLDFIDGTYWFLRGNNATHAAWIVDDILSVVDTGGAPTTGILQYWLWVGGFGYLPSDPDDAETVADPS